MHLETPNLRLVTMRREHVAPLAAIWADPVVTSHIGGPRNEIGVAASLREDVGRTELFDLWPVVEIQSGTVAGYAGIIPKDFDGIAEHELIYIFSPQFWGRGFATEIGRALIGHARARLGLSRLTALIDPENVASIRVAEKLGFGFEREIVRDGGHVKRLFAQAI